MGDVPDMDSLVQWVGAERFERACAQAWRQAPGTGRRRERQETDDPNLPHELADLVSGDLDLAIALYRAMPCYANLMHVDHWAPRSEFLAELATLLDEPDAALADPVSYWLWCGPFEEAEPRAIDAWSRLTADASEVRLLRLLDVSGPVPWPAKAPVFESLRPTAAWHPVIWRALKDAGRDYFGRVDVSQAWHLLDQLDGPPPDVDAEALREALRGRRST